MRDVLVRDAGDRAAVWSHREFMLADRRYCYPLTISVTGLHVGGKSALDWHGVRHQVALRQHLELYGWASGPLPAWFTERFPSRYQRLRLFRERPSAPG